MKLDTILTIIFGVMIIVVASLLFILFTKRSDTTTINTSPTVQNQGESPATGTPFLVPFEYTVVEVTETQISLNGERGLLSLPQDPDTVTVYFQEGDKKIPASLTDVRIGLKANLVINPGVSAELSLIRKGK